SYCIERWPEQLIWPTRALEQRVVALAADHRADVVLFGHGFPLPWIAPGLAARGIPSVALTHGAEVWIARTPGLAAAQRRGLRACRAVTRASPPPGPLRRGAPGAPPPLTVLYPGVDTDRFAPSVDGRSVRERFGVGDRPLVVCVSRLVPRKGQDVLIEAMRSVR